MRQIWIRPFLHALACGGIVVDAAHAAGISTSTAYALRAEDDDFKAAWEQAIEDHTDIAERELTRRAMGFDSIVLYQGSPVPIWERDERGQIVQQTVVRTRPDGGEDVSLIPVQARHPDGSLQYVTERKYSDTLLLAKVKAYRKDRYAERTEHTGKGGEPLQLDESTVAARISSLMSVAQQRKFENEIA